MILLDTTVLVHYLRTRSPSIRGIFEAGAAICGVTRAEVLHGARTAHDIAKLIEALDGFVQIPIEQETWDALGANLSLLRSRGVVTPFPDALIATVAIRSDLELWTYDAHFNVIQNVLPALRLFSGPKL
jgi:predicted nucleic acid-binding protein